ncbi:MAG TPA: DUF1059 domain-containing protein [Acidobacteriota bacterium]|jgi:hypothetical protein
MAEPKEKTLNCNVPGCSLTVSGTEKDVVDAVVLHAVAAHGQKDSPQFREQVRSMLEDAN